MQVQGYFDLRFEAVRDAFAALFENPQERGAAVCIQVGGETVVDLWAGHADRQGEHAWHSDTLVNVFSCTKPFAAVAALQLVAEGRLQLDAPVAAIWPEFAAAGKQDISLRQLLSHRAGVTAIRQRLAVETLYDWNAMCAALAAEAPWWTPGEAHGYAPLTYGWLIGELLRRADGRSAGRSIIARTAQSLGLDFHIGLDAAEFDRVSDVGRTKGNPGDEDARRLVDVMLNQPQAMSTLSFSNPPSAMTSTNSPQWRSMEQPAANGHGNARSLAGFYTGLLDGRLLDPALLAEMTREHSRGPDRTLLTQTRLGLGCMLEQSDHPSGSFGLGPQAFGHPGAGGCLGFADPDRQLAFGFVSNSLGPYVLMDPRAQALARAAGQCLG
jgi:CubicO group peptidase (beta-lactamase class C family)